ncbi:MAG: DUF945 family protein [Granulosicoccus sp.]
MKKLIIALPFVAGAAAIAGTSQYSGSQTESEYHELLAQLNRQLHLVFVNERYDSGMIKSSAVTKVMTSRSADAELLFRLQHDIEHAPLRMGTEGMNLGTVSINTQLLEDTSGSQEFAAWFANSTPFTIKTDVKYTGEIINQVRINALEISDEGVDLNWSGLQFDSKTQNGATVGEGSLGTWMFNDENSGGVINVESGQLNLDVQHHGDNIYTGDSTVTFDSVSVSSPDIPVPVALSRFELYSGTDMEGEVMNGNTRISLKGIDSPLPLQNASMDIEMEGLVVEGMRRYNDLVVAATSDPDSNMDDSVFLESIAGALADMVGPGSALRYAIDLGNAEGDVNADIRLGVKEASADGMSENALKNVVTGRDLLNVITLNGSLNADVAALAGTPVMMMLGGVGEFVTVTDESILSEVSLEGTTLNVNGVEMPLDILSGGMLDVPFSDLLQM